MSGHKRYLVVESYIALVSSRGLNVIGDPGGGECSGLENRPMVYT